MHAESVPELMGPTQACQVTAAMSTTTADIDATKCVHMPPSTGRRTSFKAVDNGGWSGLRYPSDMLSHCAAERSLTKGQEADHLAQVRTVVDAVASDETLSASDRSRIVDLLLLPSIVY